jgi:hypothetical protein
VLNPNFTATQCLDALLVQAGADGRCVMTSTVAKHKNLAQMVGAANAVTGGLNNGSGANAIDNSPNLIVGSEHGGESWLVDLHAADYSDMDDDNGDVLEAENEKRVTLTAPPPSHSSPAFKTQKVKDEKKLTAGKAVDVQVKRATKRDTVDDKDSHEDKFRSAFGRAQERVVSKKLVVKPVVKKRQPKAKTNAPKSTGFGGRRG